MADLGDIGQKIKGKLQKTKGSIQQNTSNHPADKLKGGMSKLKGSVNEGIADLKINSGRRRRPVRRWDSILG